MVIYLDQFKPAKAEPTTWLKNVTYGDEVMQAGWNPALIHMLPESIPALSSHELPRDMSTVDVDAFLNRVYELATLI